MADFDLEAVLAPISPDSPCGEDLSYDPAYMELERAIHGTGERQMGDAVIEAEEPNWNEIRKQSLELMKRTRDLRVIVYFSLASLKKSGLPGARDGLVLLDKTLEQYWDGVHPVLDPDDGFDPTESMNILAGLSIKGGFQDPIAFNKRLCEAVLVSVPGIGRYTYRDWQVATGKLPAPKGETNVPTEGLIAGAFTSADPASVAQMLEAARQARDSFAGINQTIVSRAGVNRAPDLGELEETLTGMVAILESKGTSRPAQHAEASPETGAGFPAATSAGQATAHATSQVNMVPGEIASREDVIDALDRICRYYDRHEPSSPLPLLLKRARRLVAKSFMEIISDLSPEALPQVQALGGVSAEEAGEQTA